MSLLPWQLGSTGSPAEALCLLLHSKELSVPALGGEGAPRARGDHQAGDPSLPTPTPTYATSSTDHAAGLSDPSLC